MTIEELEVTAKEGTVEPGTTSISDRDLTLSSLGNYCLWKVEELERSKEGPRTTRGYSTNYGPQ
jgi:hypothetical protein